MNAHTLSSKEQTMTHKYYLLSADISRRFAHIKAPEPHELMELTTPLTEGTPLNEPLPDEIIFELDPHGGVMLLDMVLNTFDYYIVSERLCNWFHSVGLPMESYPVSIRNHRGRIHKEPYYALNLLGTIDCVDREKSEYTMLNPDDATPMRDTRVVLDTSKIPEDARLFRPSFLPWHYIFRDDLCAELRQVTPIFTGVVLMDPKDHGTYGLSECDEV